MLDKCSGVVLKTVRKNENNGKSLEYRLGRAMRLSTV